MRKGVITVLFCLCAMFAYGQNARFAIITDNHFGQAHAPDATQAIISDINADDNIDFVIFLGDLTEAGRDSEFAMAYDAVQRLAKPWYALTGNRDTKYPESWSASFKKFFGPGRFCFEAGGYRFVGIPSGPYLTDVGAMFLREDIEVFSRMESAPTIMFSHHPSDNVRNAHELLASDNAGDIAAWFCGHLHSDKEENKYGIKTFVCIAALRAVYNLVEISGGELKVYSRNARKKSETKRYEGKLAPSGKLTGTEPPRQDKNPRWSYRGHSAIPGGGAVSGRSVVFGHMDGNCVSLDAETGGVLWQAACGGQILSSPMVLDGRLYYGTADSLLICRDAASGQIVWQFKADGPIGNTPATDGNRIYFGTTKSLYAVSLENGTQIWATPSSESLIYSSPVFTAGTITVGGVYGNIQAFDTRSGIKKSEKVIVEDEPKNMLIATNMVVVDGMPCFCSRTNGLFVLDANRGEFAVEDKTRDYYPCIGAAADSLFVRTDSGVACMRYSGGGFTTLWECQLPSKVDLVASKIVAGENYIHVPTASGLIYVVGRQCGQLHKTIRTGNYLITSINCIPGSDDIVVTLARGDVLRFEIIRANEKKNR